SYLVCFFFQAEDGIRDFHVTGVQTCALPIYTHDVQIENAPTAVDRVRHGHPVHHEKNLTTSAAADVDIGHTLVANLDLRSVVEGQNLRCLVDDRACLNGEYVGCRIETGERLHRISTRRTTRKGHVRLNHPAFGYNLKLRRFDRLRLELDVQSRREIRLYDDVSDGPRVISDVGGPDRVGARRNTQDEVLTRGVGCGSQLESVNDDVCADERFARLRIGDDPGYFAPGL